METKEKITTLEEKGFNWFEIADLLDMHYNDVRAIAEGDYEPEEGEDLRRPIR